MTFTNTDSPNIGLNLALYMSMVGLDGYVNWLKLPKSWKSHYTQLITQINPIQIKTKIKEEINK